MDECESRLVELATPPGETGSGDWLSEMRDEDDEDDERMDGEKV